MRLDNPPGRVVRLGHNQPASRYRSAPGAPSLIAAKVLAGLGAIDILVNNAATVEPTGSTATVEPEDWARAVAVNLTGPVRLTLAVLDAMIG